MSEPLPPLHVAITREPFSDYFVLTLDDGQVEELSAEDTHKWFDERGANMYEVGKMLDHVWNFGSADVTISKPIKPKVRQHSTAPEL
jgi:hypothetical protein